ncbi:MAG TPA: cytochrome b/b6 domain-containing protein [Burkholderiales bacterium]|nr:cytochrome b/b6 domain-containing protein [Burkholderiales bacterium]
MKRRIAAWALAGAACLAGVPSLAAAADTPAAPGGAQASGQAAEQLNNETCLACHGTEGFQVPGPDGKMRDLHVDSARFGHSVHGKRMCVECHKDIQQIPHRPGVQHKVSCVECHEDLWAQAQREGKTAQFARLGVVVEQINGYMKSIHARPSRADQSRTNATCYNCHDAHYVYPKGSPAWEQWRLTVPDICGKCHVKERAEYATSIHGELVLKYGIQAAPVCADCHSMHNVESPKLASVRVLITKNCGKCHQEQLRTYLGTYHGQITQLGYGYTAKCFDCHGHHTIKRVDDPRSSVYPANRLETCQKCHQGATAGFVTFEPHGNAHDFKHYPYLWLAARFMVALLAGVFAFFWTHMLLWFYREYRDRQERKTRPYVKTGEMALPPEGKYFQRFGPLWRLAHLLLAISVMGLVLTGMSVLYGSSPWAPVVMRWLGSPKVAAIVHRTFASVFITIFLVHLIYFAVHIVRKGRSFRWFGPTSLVPRWQDFKDIVAMFKWFVGKGPRPGFDRWTYWEKFDYWAVFWGFAIIGGSGLMLWFPNVTASVLPGWVFNVATLVHGEEAILAAVFLFTVHFFNNHFRPDKFPLDIVMFTGAVSLEEFKREHAVEFKRLVDSGELDRHLVDVPSRPMTLGSRILGFTLISIGLVLLILVIIGFIGSAGLA